MDPRLDPRGMSHPADQPWLDYAPGELVRFFRSQRSWPAEGEAEYRYRPPSAGAQTMAGWAAARAFPNLVPFTGGARAYYALPSGPTNPQDFWFQRRAPAPPFPTDLLAYQGTWAPGVPRISAPQAFDGAPRGEVRNPDDVGCCKPVFLAPRPANVDTPVRAFEFNDAPLNSVVVNDNATFTTVVTHRVPTGLLCVVRQFAVQAETPAALTDVEVRITVGGQPVPRYDSLNAPDLGTFQNPAVTNIKAIEDQVVAVIARPRTAGAAHNVRALLRGWDFQPSLMTNLDSIEGWRGR